MLEFANYNPIEIMQMLSAIFFSIVFFQSSIDKILDRKGNIEFFEEHFKTTLLNKILSPALSILTFLELIAAGICMFGLFYSLLYQNTDFIFYGLVTSGIVLLMLLFGQRIAKDYVGAADITIYFILCAITILSYNIKG